MTLEEIEDLIIECLAADAGVGSVEMRSQLEAAGADMPVDSLLAAEVVSRVEERCGVSLPATAENARRLRTVRSFAEAIAGLLAESSETAAVGSN